MSLQEVFQAAYEQSFYDRRLPYRDLLAPALGEEEDAWVKRRLTERGLAS